MRNKAVVCFSMLAFLLVSCSEKTNINQLFVSKKQKESLVSLFERAQLEYDKGNFEDALDLAEKAEDISPKNEDIAVLIGYIHLALAGMDTFRIAEAMIEATNRDKKQEKEDDSAGLASKTNNAANFLNTLREKLNLTDENLAKLGEFSDDDDLDAFKDYAVILPKTATEARESDLSVFVHINAAIEKICPFVNDGAKTADADERHNEERCVPSEVTRKKKAVSHFLWAFAHVVEASVFYSVVQYTESGETNPNLQKRADALEASKDSLGPADYAVHVVNLGLSVNSILDFENQDSQFNAILNNITVASLAFQQIGSVPYKVKRALEKAVNSINSTKDEATGSDEEQQKANALKKQINEKMTKQVQEQIEALSESDPEGFEENQEELCEAYVVISGTENLPDACEEE